jgi:uncharacterized protein YndB with AHSA1/START domain
MYEIKHLYHIAKPRHEVFQALTTRDGLAGWWTSDVSGDTGVGGVITFRFGAQWMNQMKVVHLETDREVVWECVAGAPEWIGNKIAFRLDENEGKTRIRFSHADWQQQEDFYAACNFSWGRYLESLRQYCQTGTGAPFTAPKANN